mmetsp:Transcript_25778/g.33789  ORF Transcript_25778/g.33789 Transcript_25778/m.33789 type:complete len:256 (+) Transcript_25778:196-963(+)
MEGIVTNRALQQKLHVFAKNFLRTNQFECVSEELSKLGKDVPKEELNLANLGVIKRQFTAGIEWLVAQEEDLNQIIEWVSSKITSASKDHPPTKKQRVVKSKGLKRSKSKGTWNVSNSQEKEPQIGDKVAANVIYKGEWQWIFAKVVKYHAIEDTWEVIDDDDQEQGAHFLKRHNLLVLPKESEARGDAYEVGARVLAMYPDTTVFYNGTISGQPFTLEGKQYCLVQFDGDEEKDTGLLPHRNVEAQFVALSPSG